MEVATVFLPGLAALIVGLFGHNIGDKPAQLITSAAVLTSAVLACIIFVNTAILPLMQPAGQAIAYTVPLGRWIDIGTFSLDWAIRIDTLSAIMLAVVTVVSAAVHIYSIGYMSDDPDKPRFMAYLSLFTFAMLMLVAADNLVQLFFGWEGVGLASYLLIGFWFKKASANAAAIKAFVVNRVADLFFMLGIFACFALFDSLIFTEIFAPEAIARAQDARFFGLPALEVTCALLFIGAMGKSAQIVLHTWLPDAMEGPTPVSALIHAATMVTAGIFMMIRISPILEYAPMVMLVVTLVGITTALVAATIALTQFDIKRVIAYSTMSQLGYMFFAIGVSAYGAAIFHLMTHAFFKALLFLGAGSVIHALHGEQDMRKMGGLFHKIDVTAILMIVGSLALAGAPLLSGYYSKDMILEAAFFHYSWWGQVAYWLGVLVALLTAFYGFRLIYMTFFGAHRGSMELYEKAHEAPPSMLVPMVVLAIGSVAAGRFFYEFFVGHLREAFYMKSIFVLPANDSIESAHLGLHSALQPMGWVAQLPVTAGLTGILLATLFYLWRTELPDMMARLFAPLHKLFYNKWYFDELYESALQKPLRRLADIFWQVGDIGLIDRFGPDGFAALSQNLAARLSRLQTGYVFHYAFMMVLGLVGLMSWVLYIYLAG